MTVWLITNWEYILLGIFIAEKAVKLSPMKWDDILVDGIKAALFKMAGKK